MTDPDMILVHADGGPCHGCPIENGRCVGCGIAPDMQSTELRRFVTMATRVSEPAGDTEARYYDALSSLSDGPLGMGGDFDITGRRKRP